MAKITPRAETDTVVVKTKQSTHKSIPMDWWNNSSKRELGDKLLSTVTFLKEQNQYRYRQAGMYARLYGNLPLSGLLGSSLTRTNTMGSLPIDRPTMSVITSGVDTLVSRLSQTKPRPVFLTDNADYKQRSLAKQLNQFIIGEFYKTKAYEVGPLTLRDAAVLGTGVVKILEDQNKRVSLERRINTELMVDANESLYGEPRQLFELKLVDRSQLMEMFPGKAAAVENAEQAYPDSTGEISKTISNQVLVAEGWHLPSGPDATDGVHAIVTSGGVLFDEDYEKDYFPFQFLQYSPRIYGFWGQGLAERQMGTQMGINQLLATIHASINLVGVPRVFVEEGSKVVKAHLNNQVGAIVTYRGTKPIYEVAPCVPVELYQQLQRLIDYAYQQEGISQLSAQGQKPQGLNSGEAIRRFEDVQSDRFAALQKRYEDFYNGLAYKMIDKAKDIAERDGKYATVYPNKDGTKEIDLPKADMLDNPYVIQCYDESSLPKDPAGRAQKIIEYMQSGLYTQQEGRRLLGFPDTEQEDKLNIASEERILKILDEIVEEGKYTPPDPFMDLQLAETKVVQYYNLYAAAKLEEERAQLLRDFFTQIQTLKQASMPPAPPMGMPGQPQAAPMPMPQSDMIPNVPGAIPGQ